MFIILCRKTDAVTVRIVSASVRFGGVIGKVKFGFDGFAYIQELFLALPGNLQILRGKEEERPCFTGESEKEEKRGDSSLFVFS